MSDEHPVEPADEPVPDDDGSSLADWIDAHDPPALRRLADRDVADVLDAQRAAHGDEPVPEFDSGPGGASEDGSSAMAPIVDNVGDDGGAASG